MSASSPPPPSEKIPGTSSGGAPYVLGILVLGVLAGGLFCWKSRQTPTTTAQSLTAPPVSAAPKAPELPQFAPPPPPKLDEVSDAGPAPTAKSTAGAGTGAPASPGFCVHCTEGQPSSALTSAVRSRAQSAQSCYNRALQHNSGVAGNMTVSVQVGSNGVACGASITNDSVNSSEVSSCVLGRFRGQSFPPPTSGCVTLNVPINFTVKQ